MKKIEKIIFVAAIAAITGSIFGMDNSPKKTEHEVMKEQCGYANNHIADMVKKNADGAIVFKTALDKAKEFYKPGVESVNAPASGEDKILIQATFDSEKNPTGEFQRLYHYANAARMIAAMSRAQIKLVPALGGQIYLQVGKKSYEEFKKIAQVIEKSKKNSTHNRSRSFNSADIDSRIFELSTEKEKMAQQLSELSKQNANLQYSNKNGHANGHSNGSEADKKAEHQARELHIASEELRKKIHENENQIQELKSTNEKLSAKVLESTGKLTQLADENGELKKGVKQLTLTFPLLEYYKNKKELLESEVSTISGLLQAEKNSWRKYFVGGAVALASYTGLKAAYNWYMNKA
ncbi:MAG TPA: hypothetical protein VHO47_03980 [Candidatus Babeliales bacterium]|nr:hypothetical protein [Candidatus Babeliales bacterium]